MTEPEPARSPSGFDRVASTYELLAHIYSTGQIRAAKASQLDRMRAGDRVLYVGVGGGEDAVLAAQRGVVVTCIDLSQGMLDRTRAKLDRAGASAELIHGNVIEHRRRDHYDVVTANFFLNCFREADMQEFLAHLAGLVRVGGRLLIADVAVPQGNAVYRLVHRLHNFVAISTFCLLGLVPMHRIYDYRRYFADVELETEQVQTFRLLRYGPISYESISAIRTAPRHV